MFGRFFMMCHFNMTRVCVKQMDPEPVASSAVEMNRERVPAQSSLLLAVSETLPIFRSDSENKKESEERAIHVFPKDRVLQPAAPYADYEYVPKAAGRARSAKRTRSPVVSPPGSTGNHLGEVCIYFTELLAYLSGLQRFWSVRLTLLPALCARLLLTRPVTLTAMNGVSLLFLPSCLATQQNIFQGLGFSNEYQYSLDLMVCRRSQELERCASRCGGCCHAILGDTIRTLSAKPAVYGRWRDGRTRW